MTPSKIIDSGDEVPFDAEKVTTSVSRMLVVNVTAKDVVAAVAKVVKLVSKFTMES